MIRKLVILQCLYLCITAFIWGLSQENLKLQKYIAYICSFYRGKQLKCDNSKLK